MHALGEEVQLACIPTRNTGPLLWRRVHTLLELFLLTCVYISIVPPSLCVYTICRDSQRKPVPGVRPVEIFMCTVIKRMGYAEGERTFFLFFLGCLRVFRLYVVTLFTSLQRLRMYHVYVFQHTSGSSVYLVS